MNFFRGSILIGAILILVLPSYEGLSKAEKTIHVVVLMLLMEKDRTDEKHFRWLEKQIGDKK